MAEEREAFEALLSGAKNALERFVYYKISNRADAQDVLQEIRLAAFRAFPTLNDRARFKPWLMSLARNRVVDYYRRRARAQTAAYPPARVRRPSEETRLVRETLNHLSPAERALLTDYYLEGYSQRELSQRLDIPVGTVKSRLYAARDRFRRLYPDDHRLKGANRMFPEILPPLAIAPSPLEPFRVLSEQAIGWFIVPRMGETAHMATYDYDPFPRLRKTGETRVQVLGQARVHGLPCLEVRETESNETETCAMTMFMRVEDGRLQTLAALTDGPIKRLSTFLDEDFLENWGYGDDNAGEETLRMPRGEIVADGDGRLSILSPRAQNIDVVGRYDLRIGARTFDTVRLLYATREGVAVEWYVAQDGRAVLFRRFNRDDWQSEARGSRWTERLPASERLTIDGQTYVHWYNCLPDYAFQD